MMSKHLWRSSRVLSRPYCSPMNQVSVYSSSSKFPGLQLLSRCINPLISCIHSLFKAASKDLKVIITPAGGLAHLSGMSVSMPALLVIGVTVNASSLRGMDSLLSIAQMTAVSSFCLLNYPAPRRLFTGRMSVGTISINNSANVAELGARILALDDSEVRLLSNQNLEKQTATVVENSKKMRWEGFDNYLIHYGKGWIAIHE